MERKGGRGDRRRVKKRERKRRAEFLRTSCVLSPSRVGRATCWEQAMDSPVSAFGPRTD